MLNFWLLIMFVNMVLWLSSFNFLYILYKWLCLLVFVYFCGVKKVVIYNLEVWVRYVEFVSEGWNIVSIVLVIVIDVYVIFIKYFVKVFVVVSRLNYDIIKIISIIWNM